MEEEIINNEFNQIVAKNIFSLRSQNKITQLELAEKINYSDKIVSKWERGEAIPSVEVLAKLAKIFDVSLDFFVTPHHEKEFTKSHKSIKINIKTIAMFSICGLWAILAIVFVSLFISSNIILWQLFVWAVPATFVILVVFSCIWYKCKHLILLSSCLLWTLLTATFFQFINANMWVVFLIGVPLQIAILFIKKLKF